MVPYKETYGCFVDLLQVTHFLVLFYMGKMGREWRERLVTFDCYMTSSSS